MKFAKYFAGFLLLAIVSARGVAAPITYTFTGNWTDPPTGDFGASYIATLVFDNGGISAANQVFTQSDFISGRLQSGTYDFTMGPSDITSWDSNFSSDGLGRLGGGWFDAESADSSWHFDLDFEDPEFSNQSGEAGYFANMISNPGTVGAAAATPVPALPLPGLVLMVLGLLALAIRRL